MEENCLFCKLKDKRILEKVFLFDFGYSSCFSRARFGHSKKDMLFIARFKKEEWNELHEAIKKTIKKIENSNFKEVYKTMKEEKPSAKSTFFCNKMLKHKSIGKKPEGYNIGNNEGEVAGRTIHHLHIQIIPRYKGDVSNPTGGIRTIIPELGNYK
jgi:galactose-1-phosphate uridylyltransferase